MTDLNTTDSIPDGDAILDEAHRIAHAAIDEMDGKTMAVMLTVLGVLLANAERQSDDWDRDQILAEVCEVADSCAELEVEAVQ